MIKGDFEQLRDIAANNQCAQHKARLEVVGTPDDGVWVLRCGKGEFPEKIERVPTVSEEFRVGAPLPSTIADNITRVQKRRALAEGADASWGELVMVPRRDLATNAELTIQQVQGLCEYAGRYGLDPGRGHVVMMYSKPYITIDGYLYHARQTSVVYRLHSRPLGAEEKTVYQVPEGAHAWLAEIIMADGNVSFTGLGIVTVEEMTEMSKGKPGQLRSPVVARHPWQLAQKRAEWQALRRAFPIGETDREEVG